MGNRVVSLNWATCLFSVILAKPIYRKSVFQKKERKKEEEKKKKRKNVAYCAPVTRSSVTSAGAMTEAENLVSQEQFRGSRKVSSITLDLAKYDFRILSTRVMGKHLAYYVFCAEFNGHWSVNVVV